jgi:hypothetical protein
MIGFLRTGALTCNVTILGGVPWWLGAGLPASLACVAAGFALAWWACGRAPRGDEAPAEVQAAARDAARKMGAPPPRFVRTLPGWTAAAVRDGRAGYGLLLGAEVAPAHRLAVLAHEIAHVTTGDLRWEPFTDGPARMLVQALRPLPPLVVIVFPFLLFGAPLAHATEIRADCLAADTIPDYAAVLREVAPKMGVRATLLYPSLARRVRRSARGSNG